VCLLAVWGGGSSPTEFFVAAFFAEWGMGLFRRFFEQQKSLDFLNLLTDALEIFFCEVDVDGFFEFGVMYAPFGFGESAQKE
jgi:hypothetical protein